MDEKKAIKKLPTLRERAEEIKRLVALEAQSPPKRRRMRLPSLIKKIEKS